MRTVETLLREAITRCGGPAALATAIGLHRSEVTEMEKGRRAISPATVALLCSVLELDGTEAQRLAAEAVIANAKAPLRARIRRAFFLSLAVGAALLAGTTMTDETLPTMAGARPTSTVDGLYIVAHRARRWNTLSPPLRALRALREWLLRMAASRHTTPSGLRFA